MFHLNVITRCVCCDDELMTKRKVLVMNEYTGLNQSYLLDDVIDQPKINRLLRAKVRISGH